VPPEKLEAAVRGIAALGLRGCNVTTPHKQAIFPLLDRVDDLARRIGAVNTVVVEQDGTLTGFNNDGNGFIQSLRDADPRWRPDTGPITVLGAGGAARAVVASLAAQGAREIRVTNRTRDKAREIADAVGSVVKVVPWEVRDEALDGIALLANATTLGMAGKPSLDIALDRLPLRALVGDLIYVPPETPLLAAARARGNITVNGLGLLLNQARPAFQAWFGVMPEITPALRHAVAATF
jgi:shikimate dehydrogenase